MIFLVFHDVLAYVSCRGYVSILLSAWNFHETRWYRGLYVQLVLEADSRTGFFIS